MSDRYNYSVVLPVPMRKALHALAFIRGETRADVVRDLIQRECERLGAFELAEKMQDRAAEVGEHEAEPIAA